MRSGFLGGGGVGPRVFPRRGAAAVSSGWWGVAGQTCVAAYQPIGAASLAASYVNLANPGTYDAAPGVAPGLAAGGWAFNGTDQYLICNYVPQSSGTVIIRGANFGNTSSLIGSEKSTGGIYLFIYRHVVSGVSYANVDNAIGAYNTPAATSGIFAVAGRVAYRNGSAETNGSSAVTGTINRGIAIGGRYAASGAIIERMIGTICAIAIYDSTLSAAQVAAVSAAMAALA